MEKVIVILGGARSGKSSYAQRLAVESKKPVIFLATAHQNESLADPEMVARIAAHRRERPTTWQTIEESRDLARAIREHATTGDLIIVDCITLWVSNVIGAEIAVNRVDDLAPEVWDELERTVIERIDAMLLAASERKVSLIIVSNEVGLGIVPAYPLGRRYRDLLGRVNQRLAMAADVAILMVAGLPVDLRKLAPVGLFDPEAT